MTLYGPTHDEAARAICDRLLLGPAEITTRAVAGEVEVRAVDEVFGEGVLFAIVWEGLSQRLLQQALDVLERQGWVPTRPLRL
jgi:hypothetical protein